MRLGYALGSGFAQDFGAIGRTRGTAPMVFSCYRQGEALPHIGAAKPDRMTSSALMRSLPAGHQQLRGLSCSRLLVGRFFTLLFRFRLTFLRDCVRSEEHRVGK